MPNHTRPLLALPAIWVAQTGCIHTFHRENPKMRLIRSLLIISAIAYGLAGVATLHAGDGKQKHTFSFHAETQQAGANRTFAHTVNGEEKYFQMTPEITHHNFSGFVPFRADDGSYGAAFVLDRRGAIKLNTWTTSQQGSYMVASVDMKAADHMLIDRPIKDGVLVLWRGLEAEHIEFLQKGLKLRVLTAAGQMENRE